MYQTVPGYAQEGSTQQTANDLCHKVRQASSSHAENRVIF